MRNWQRESGCLGMAHGLISCCRFIDCEAWRKEFDLDNLVPNFDYTEKHQVFQYYPQYYHKTDKVLALSPHPCALVRN